MPSQENLQLRGRLAASEETLKTVELGIDVDIDELRVLLDKHAPKTELQPKRIKLVSDRLCDSLATYGKLTDHIAAMKEDLG